MVFAEQIVPVLAALPDAHSGERPLQMYITGARDLTMFQTLVDRLQALQILPVVLGDPSDAAAEPPQS